MMFSTVSIEKYEGKLVVWFHEVPGDRVDEDRGPSPLGHYHYPRPLGKEAAFHKLRDSMMHDLAVLIDKLNREYKELAELRFPEGERI